ncbi:keratinocyte differentiation factor 1 [Sphaerodactylus townsendi]|uniref:keratinocyte differentiation factor 1 n=1 Tax=Sphaerodactylus townsendi TaxID=933632 RepID=UPI002026B365|nr:keratinocyte differentiation factor 1 [Sphaerodactylus townsendi]XP_048355185.1 keratinocyte differentiation factor 1 [Sphaerodactylus townsendi]XP_048355186.1 keratinocyte differentiation factor 1 [Sphaerodactylus townsendi]XP_048355187.1 keratinocyte differentiation factor 1 [Sphaerodactylus townsendi]
MLGRRTGYPHSPAYIYQPPQDGVPQRFESPTTNDISLEVFCGSTPEYKQNRRPVRDRRAYKADPSDSNGREGENASFISSAAEASPPPCCPNLSRAWSTYRTIFCYIVTCGSCFKDCRASIPYPYNENLMDDGKPRETNGCLPNSPANSNPAEKNGSQTKKSTVKSSFSYPDVKLKGIPVFPNRSPGSRADSDSCYKEPLPDKTSNNSIEKQPLPSSHRSSEEYYSFHESDFEFSELSSMSSREIDVLIFRKLTELFSVHQIDELAKCTSDTVFLEKTNKISDLINSITQDYHLDEQDAECRLVRGIIRISTRKSRVRPRISVPTLPSPEETTMRCNPPDSGNETMVASVLSSEEDMSVQISQETTADVKARVMRHEMYSTPGSPLSRGSSFQDTETDSSGAPLLKCIAGRMDIGSMHTARPSALPATSSPFCK